LTTGSHGSSAVDRELQWAVLADWEVDRCVGIAQQVVRCVRVGQQLAHVVGLNFRGQIHVVEVAWQSQTYALGMELTFSVCRSRCLIHGLKLGLGLFFAIESHRRGYVVVIREQVGTRTVFILGGCDTSDHGLEFCLGSLFEICL
jgi:hypothetical protein